MRAKLIVGTLCITALLCGCGNDAKVIEGEVQTKATAKEAMSGEDADTGTVDAAGSVGEQPQEKAVEYRGYAFVYEGAVIEMDADAAPVVEQLGEPDSYFEAPSCAFEGIDKMYTYGGFELDTYPMEDKDYISAVIFKDDTLATIEGIGIGDSVSRLEEVYGTQWNDEDGMIVYEKDGTKLCFVVEDDTVISVEFRSGVTEQ